MKRNGRMIVTTGLALGLATGALAGTTTAAPATASATATTAAGAAQTAGAATTRAERRLYHPRERFAREFTKRGERDRSTYDIEHVRELQIRLRRAGVYHGRMTGFFGKRTYRAVKRFQRHHRKRLTVNGNADIRTWRLLIRKTVRARRAIPRWCKRPNGWYACYDRKRHQVTLWKRGKLWNSWLVRGGARSSPTRRGKFRVYYRDKDHVSSLYGSPMPYSQFFSGGQAFHGSRSMMRPFRGHSHGCVNMYVEDARQLWKLTSHRRLRVRVYGAWD